MRGTKKRTHFWFATLHAFTSWECPFQYRRDFHERRHQVAGGMFRCLRCGRNFGAKCDLEKHVKGAACPGRQRTTAATSPTAAASTAFAPSTSSASARHLCNVCADTFETKAELILHSVRHIKEQVRKIGTKLWVRSATWENERLKALLLAFTLSASFCRRARHFVPSATNTDSSQRNQTRGRVSGIRK